jgi:hypothetical protein
VLAARVPLLSDHNVLTDPTRITLNVAQNQNAFGMRDEIRVARVKLWANASPQIFAVVALTNGRGRVTWSCRVIIREGHAQFAYVQHSKLTAC